jgi:pyrroline-5-carboxylate reductase
MRPTPEHWPRIALIGGGQMARALIGGWTARGAPPTSIAVADPTASQRDWLGTQFPGVALHATNAAAADGAPVWVLAVKPQLLAEAIQPLASLAQRQNPLVISIAAGIRAEDIRRWLGGEARVVRAMPNRPALLGVGVSGLYSDVALAESDRALVTRLLEAAGSVVWVDSEADMDAVTAVSGSGPAYFFLLIELLEAAGQAEGLAPEIARRLAIDTAHGAAVLARGSTDDPATLRAQVTSKGGTTAAACYRRTRRRSCCRTFATACAGVWAKPVTLPPDQSHA